MKNGLSDKVRLQHIYDAINEIESYISGFSLNDFIADSKTRFATIKQLEIIGEAAGHLDDELLQEFSEIDWRGVKAFRNVMVHEYFSVNLETVWNTVLEDIPQLKITIKKMMVRLSSPS
jgi:uncharacterized protein with HEPN domain